MEVSKKLTQFYTRSSVFKDKDVLKKGHHPRLLDDVLHRDEVIDKYLTVLHEAIDGKVPDNLFIYGTFGTGKTMLTKLITSEIALAAENLGNKVIVVYIYCETLSAPSPMMQYINQSLINSMHDAEKLVGITMAKNFDYFYKLVDKFDGPILLIFDEIDKLKHPDIINQIARIKECGFTKNNVCVIGITNDTNFYDNLNGRTKSVLGQNELYIPPYDAEQLNDILTSRANAAFVEGSLEEMVIPLCAAFGAQENGDARTAIDILRTSGDIADQRNSKMIEEIDVRAAKEGMELNRQLEVVGGLPTQTKSVLVACALKYSKNKESVETSEIYAEYLRICEIISVEPVKPRRVNDYLGELSVLGVLSVNKISRGRRRGVFNAIRPLADTGALMEVILQDYRFENLKRRLERV
ncbi:MAG: AAA family ATPase [Methanosarcina sp.]|uniref:Cdc6/Cdc18 family protein n=1 Tax=Methanosarcina sp. TaxID=2213 RepID=UPI0026060D67|nr:AAA family ATPase [Methanosarcina sp.]MDD3248703.1 AAA family ATPase [Methanosarcina sp.]